MAIVEVRHDEKQIAYKGLIVCNVCGKKLSLAVTLKFKGAKNRSVKCSGCGNSIGKLVVKNKK